MLRIAINNVEGLGEWIQILQHISISLLQAIGSESELKYRLVIDYRQLNLQMDKTFWSILYYDLIVLMRPVEQVFAGLKESDLMIKGRIVNFFNKTIFLQAFFW